jgi:hypothetical protein
MLRPHVRRSLSVAAAGILALALTSCTGRGGGQLPPAVGFAGPASFGFSFSCEDSGGLNRPAGRLKIQLSYTDHGRSPLGSAFSIHGTADVIDSVTESMICAGQNPPPGTDQNLLTFLGRYRLTSSAPAGLPSTCGGSTPICRFEVTVRDSDEDQAPSPGDYFDITLSGGTTVAFQLDAATLVYKRHGYLSSGNLTVD